MSKIGLVTGPGSVDVPIKVDLAELRAALIAARHPVAYLPEWTGCALYVALIYEPVLVARPPSLSENVLSERVTRIVHIVAKDEHNTMGEPSDEVIQAVRDAVRTLTKTKVVDESIHVSKIGHFGKRLVSDIQTES